MGFSTAQSLLDDKLLVISCRSRSVGFADAMELHYWIVRSDEGGYIFMLYLSSIYTARPSMLSRSVAVSINDSYPYDPMPFYSGFPMLERHSCTSNALNPVFPRPQTIFPLS